ncbi:hypothetical protein BO70DRAFT_378975 [Aspergillus heteromorphus CBS 117.55]|uniref:Uncharacterized protein n=1 Tax=Aspergillus heteromorphus CBS 117.55 TaxID=1448321 RepID=A0A317WID3_9EURO|nr:uncharacterized protein BO70DRAFT_378975 [Aspergillus heteromorphus CBS 117.55]PWY84818.1 hypothetical protein BO70DRAFT_378975 [Aspergillus heteromorphus CBS 117.55]
MEDARRNDHRQLGLLKEKLRSISRAAATSTGSDSSAGSEGIGLPVVLESVKKPTVEQPGSEKNPQAPGTAKSDLKFRWIHIPINHMQLIEHDFDTGDTYTKRNKLALYMPYLTPGDMPVAKEQNTESPKMDVWGEEIASFTSEDRIDRGTLQEPMTLDQYFYATIENTQKRDGDQVVTRYLSRTPETLWVWIIDDGMKIQSRSMASLNLTSPSETIITATTKPAGQTKDILSASIQDLLMSTDNRGRSERPASVNAMIELILSVTTGLFSRRTINLPAPSGKRTKERKSPLEIFRESIRYVADVENTLFKEFLESLHDEQNVSDRTHRGWIGDLQLNPYHIISKEAELLDEIKDIRDELNILRTLEEAQEKVWKQAFQTEKLESLPNIEHSNISTPTEVLRELDEMVIEAGMVQDAINTLLDLRQKQASIKEAEFGRQQANDTARQSNIVMVFTIVTIVFLPLSFLTSVFALNVSDFPHQSGNVEYQGWWIFSILFGVSACVSVPFMALAFNFHRVVKFWDSIRPNRPGREMVQKDPSRFSRSVEDECTDDGMRNGGAVFPNEVGSLGRRRAALWRDAIRRRPRMANPC